jgi:DNA-directed RNA polymerase subunit RPC12/RpoP
VNAADCGYSYCKELNYREHFHCMDCNSRVFVKKEEMIRHFKWHKKRDESLQHGFMRYSPCDDCSDKFPNCSHNRKQTHYHCLKQGCDKVGNDQWSGLTSQTLYIISQYYKRTNVSNIAYYITL